MELHDLDPATRSAMVDEIQADITAGALFMSHRFNDRGRGRWPDLMLDAAATGDPDSLELAIKTEQLLAEREWSHRNGQRYEKKVPSNAAATLASGEFIRFYMRAVCVRAIGNETKVRVYRARSVSNPRPDSANKIGQIVDPAELLEDLRRNVGMETFLGLPPGPNSGLCVRLV